MRVEIYSKPECLLCEEAKAALRRVQERVPFEWREIDVTGDLALRQRYRYDLPALVIDGTLIFRHRIDEASLEALLRAGT